MTVGEEEVEDMKRRHRHLKMIHFNFWLYLRLFGGTEVSWGTQEEERDRQRGLYMHISLSGCNLKQQLKAHLIIYLYIYINYSINPEKYSAVQELLTVALKIWDSDYKVPAVVSID